MDLSPASWIWFPSQRTLPNTFVLFRRALHLAAAPARATGWITADSRYRLVVNGARVQWGPAPCDPRWLDADPLDLTAHLRPGPNLIGVEVLYYGLGDGTWAAGKPGLLCRIEIVYPDGHVEQVVSDDAWLTFLDRAHRPGQYKRWFLRALQEEFDARLHPYGWDSAGFVPDGRWLPAMKIAGRADKPSSCGHYWEYLGSDTIDAARCALRPRQIPPMREVAVHALRLAASGRVAWARDPRDWFEFRTPGAFEITREPVAVERGEGWELPTTTTDDRRPTTDPNDKVTRRHGDKVTDSSEAFTPAPLHPFTPSELSVVGGQWSVVGGVFATFEFAEQIVGWPRFTIEAPAGTVVELICQESHDPALALWLDTHMCTWSRFVCREGVNHFETFDFESLRWLQLHVHGASAPVRVSAVGVRRRVFDWPNRPHIRCSEPALQRLFDAGINTLLNSAQETCVDGMGRERQQYSGDGGHQLHAVRYAFGEARLPARFLRTFSEGLTLDGYFLDCWPAFDRLARVMQRQIEATGWGPLLDHGVGFNFDCWHHYLETGDLDALREPYPRLLRFAAYLEGLLDADGLLPVERIGVPAVWIDHEAYRRQRHKQCAFNLYAAAMFEYALAPIARAFGDAERADRAVALGRAIRDAAVGRFWDAARRVFVNNLPWLDEEREPRLCDRSLATALLFDQCPGGDVAASLRALADGPPELGRSYPANAGWRYWGLARHGRIDAVLRELRERWAGMRSVVENNTIQEFWSARPDTPDQWSHCAVAPIYVLFMDIAGIRPAEPGFARCTVRPQLGDLGALDLVAHTVRGPIRFAAKPHGGGHRVTLTLPAGCAGELLLPAENADLLRLFPDHPLGLKRFRIEPGTMTFLTR